MSIGILHIVGMVGILLLIIGVSIYSGRRVKDASDFTTGGGKAGAWLVCGSIMGSLVSGQATIGTAQLAFTYGLSAWWFTLGAGIGCFILALGYVAPLRHSGNITLMQIIGEEYGPKAEYAGSVLCSIGIFISVIAQVLAACALLTTIFSMGVVQAAVLAAVVMALYVIFGGAWGAGMGGIVKLILLYLATVTGAAIVLHVSFGFSGLMQDLKSVLLGTGLGQYYEISNASQITHRYVNLFARGTMKDLGSGISLLLGVLSTQTYAQAIWSGKSDSSARRGALLSACLIPPIGIGCTLIGLFMRNHYITTEEIAALKAAGDSIPAGLKEIASSSQVFPVFIEQYMPPLFGGIVLGTLVITVVGGGAGLSFGVATILVNDIFVKISDKLKDSKKNLHATRVTILAVLAASVAIAIVVPGAIINDFGFLSMGLRGAVVFIPVSFALFLKGKVDRRFAIASIILGPMAVLIGNFIPLPFDALFLGTAVCLLCCLAGLFVKQSSSGKLKLQIKGPEMKDKDVE